MTQLADTVGVKAQAPARDTGLPLAWKRYLLWRVPLALAAIVLIGQMLTMALAHVPLRRSYMDELALAVTQDHTPYRVVLLGDSVTMMATRRFELGRGRNDVANLATIAFSGAPAELFLLERYLATHPAPHYVVYAVAPDDMGAAPTPQLLHYYDWNVYDRPEEHAFLRANVPGIDARERLPAVLDVQQNILERLLSLARGGHVAMPSGERLPAKDIRPEPASDDRTGAAKAAERAGSRLYLGSLQRAVLSRMCALSRQYGFRLDIVWPPLPPGIRAAWAARDAMAPLVAGLRDVLDHGCNAGPIFDINDLRAYTNFDSSALHVLGPGWEERYAADLGAHIAALPN